MTRDALELVEGGPSRFSRASRLFLLSRRSDVLPTAAGAATGSAGIPRIALAPSLRVALCAPCSNPGGCRLLPRASNNAFPSDIDASALYLLAKPEMRRATLARHAARLVLGSAPHTALREARCRCRPERAGQDPVSERALWFLRSQGGVSCRPTS